jgi:hypothetical protein
LQRSGDLCEQREMAFGLDRVVQEPQSNPAGVEFGVDLVAGLGGGMIRAKLVCGLRISLVEKLAGDDAPLLTKPSPSTTLPMSRGVAAAAPASANFLSLRSL